MRPAQVALLSFQKNVAESRTKPSLPTPSGRVRRSQQRRTGCPRAGNWLSQSVRRAALRIGVVKSVVRYVERELSSVCALAYRYSNGALAERP